MDERSDKEKTLNLAPEPTTSPPEPTAELEKMFREHHRRVFQAAYRVTGNAQDAEDAMQTVFMRLARREGGSPLSDSAAGYLQRAAVNAALDVVRSRRHARSTPLEDVESVVEDHGSADPARDQRGREIREQVRLALTKVSERAAEIFVLRYFEGYGNNEIAKMLGTSRGTVNVILHRTRNRVKEEIERKLGDRL